MIDQISTVWEWAGGRCLSLASALKTFERVEQQPNGPISLVSLDHPFKMYSQLFLSLTHNIILNTFPSENVFKISYCVLFWRVLKNFACIQNFLEKSFEYAWCSVFASLLLAFLKPRALGSTSYPGLVQTASHSQGVWH